MGDNRKSWTARKVFLTLGALVLGVGLLYLGLRPKRVEVEAVLVTRGDLLESLRADAVFRSVVRHTLTAFADGEMKRFELKAGDEIKKNATITEIFWDVKYVPVKSPIEGVIARVFRDSAGPVRRGEPLIEVIDPSKLEAVSEVLTTEASIIPQNALVRLTNWGGDQELLARVSRVSKAGFIKPSALGVQEEKTEVLFSLNPLPNEVQSRLGHQFHAEALIEIRRHEQVLKVPIGVLFRKGSAWAVYKIQNDRAQTALVEIGPRNEHEVTITKGLTLGDLIVNYPGDKLRDGSAVKTLSSSGAK